MYRTKNSSLFNGSGHTPTPPTPFTRQAVTWRQHAQNLGPSGCVTSAPLGRRDLRAGSGRGRGRGDGSRGAGDSPRRRGRRGSTERRRCGGRRCRRRGGGRARSLGCRCRRLPHDYAYRRARPGWWPAAEQAGKRPSGGRLHRGDRAHRDREHGRRGQRDPLPAERLGRRRVGVGLTSRLAAERAPQPSVGDASEWAYPAVATAMKTLITPAPARVPKTPKKEATTAPLIAASAPPSRLGTRSCSMPHLGVGWVGGGDVAALASRTRLDGSSRGLAGSPP
jgi:hypothetical protein